MLMPRDIANVMQRPGLNAIRKKLPQNASRRVDSIED